MKHSNQVPVQDDFKARLQHLAGFSGLPHWSFDGQQDGSHARAKKNVRKKANHRFLPTLGNILSKVRGLQTWIAEERQFRVNIRELRSLNDHALRDIGLHRGDIAALASRVHSVEELNVVRQELARSVCPVVPLSSVMVSKKPLIKAHEQPQLLDNAA